MYPDTRYPPAPAAYRESYGRALDDGYDGRTGEDRNAFWLALGTGALVGAVGAAWYARRRAEEERWRRPPDSAPDRTSRLSRDGARPLTGRTVTIDKPRAEVYAFWRDFANLAGFMEHVESVTPTGADTHRWTLSAPGNRTLEMETRIVDDVENERVRWRTVEGSDIEAEGEVRFRDAPADRGTEVAATVRYRQPGGPLGLVAAKLLQIDPKTQARRELKRLKMLLETGEIATSANRADDARTVTGRA